ncbi:MAG: hypothetical protein R3F11_07260 [Verrucomicrobiales bacterium]
MATSTLFTLQIIFFIYVFSFFLKKGDAAERKWVLWRFFCMVVISGGLLQQRQEGEAFLAAELDGIIIKKFRDEENHMYPSIRVQTRKGELFFSPIPQYLWDPLQIGDEVKKGAWKLELERN